MTIEEMKAKKLEYGLTLEMIAKESGVPLGTLQKVFSGVTKAPRKQTLEAVEQVLAKEAGRRSYSMATATLRPGTVLAEAEAAYTSAPQDGRYTIDDYYALPEEKRVELIDGVFYDMTAPTHRHQMILGDLYLLFRKCVDEHNAPCDVWLSPSDVRLDRDNYTMVQPDLYVACVEEYENPNRFEGAPDLVVEILSPSTRSKDMLLKLYKYHNAGVKEYWIIDPRNRTVNVHFFDDENYDPVKYTFSDTIPIRLSGGTCEIDFAIIRDKLDKRGW